MRSLTPANRNVASLVSLAFLSVMAIASAGEPVQRVVALAPNVAELACAAGGCDRLVGVSAHSDFPPEISKLPQIGDAFIVNLEVILRLKPDLILAWGGGTPIATIERLRSLGQRVETVTVATLDDVGGALEHVGELLHSTETAHSAAENYRARLTALRARWKGAKPIRVVFQIETAPAYTINGKSFISNAIELCGGINVFANLPTLAATVSPESMLAAAPDVVLFGGEENAHAIHEYWERLSTTPAAKHDSLYAVNSDWVSRGTPRLLDGVAQVCEKLDQARARLDSTGH